jgi:anthranilate/para-aminobenzoate synthase component II
LIRHDGKGIYKGVPNPFKATRYHSLAVVKSSLPSDLEISATADDNTVMGIRHRSYPIEGVQFHPESIMTKNGDKIIKNFLASS